MVKFFTETMKVSLLTGLSQNNFMFLFNGIIVKNTSIDVTGEIFNIIKIIRSIYPM